MKLTFPQAEFDLEELVLKSKALTWLTTALSFETENIVTIYYDINNNDWVVYNFIGADEHFKDIDLAVKRFHELRQEFISNKAEQCDHSAATTPIASGETTLISSRIIHYTVFECPTCGKIVTKVAFNQDDIHVSAMEINDGKP